MLGKSPYFVRIEKSSGRARGAVCQDVGEGGFINTSLQRGVATVCGQLNRFNGFPTVRKTVKTVAPHLAANATLLKQGVNEIGTSDGRHRYNVCRVSRGVKEIHSRLGKAEVKERYHTNSEATTVKKFTLN